MWPGKSLPKGKQKCLCTYTANDKAASILAFVFVNWHSGRASRMATQEKNWKSICFCIPTRWHQCKNWKQSNSIKRAVYCRWFRDVNFWTLHCLLLRRGVIYPVTSKDKTAASFRRPICARSRVHHYMIRRLVLGAPYHEIGWLVQYSSMAQSSRNVIVKWVCISPLDIQMGTKLSAGSSNRTGCYTHNSCLHDATAWCVRRQ
jgi:hypothetical protein